MLLAAILVALILPSVAIAQTLEQRRSAAQSEVCTLQDQLAGAIERYGYACEQLEATVGAIEQNEQRIEEAEVQLAEKKANLNSRARAMYISPATEFLQVLINADDFDSFLVGMDYVRKVGDRDARLVKDVKDAQAELEAARADLQAKRAAQEAAQQEMASARANVEGQLAGARGRLGNIEQEIQSALAAREAAAAASRRQGTTPSNPSPSPAPDQGTRPPADKPYNPTTPSNPGSPNGGAASVAYAQLGKPYAWGATGPNSFDCSGLTYYCYLHGAGKSIPRGSYSQASCGSAVAVSQLASGDIVGFKSWGHVGIYVGGGSYIHAPCTGDVVKVSSLSSRGDYSGARRP